jgi:hypothetical protein
MSKGAAALHFAGEGAGVGAKAAGSITTSPGQGVGAAPVALGALGLIPVGALAGSIVGAVKGISTEKIKETEDALNGYLATLNFQETMRERFLSVAREETPYPFVPLEAKGPNVLDQEVTFDSLSDKGIDTVLEISVRRCGLWGKRGDIDPFLRLRMAVGIRLIRLTDAKVIYSRVFIDEWGEPFKFSDWGANDALRFKEAVNRSFPCLATEIVKELSRIQTPLNPQPSHVIEIK